MVVLVLEVSSLTVVVVVVVEVSNLTGIAVVFVLVMANNLLMDVVVEFLSLVVAVGEHCIHVVSFVFVHYNFVVVVVEMYYRLVVGYCNLVESFQLMFVTIVTVLEKNRLRYLVL